MKIESYLERIAEALEALVEKREIKKKIAVTVDQAQAVLPKRYKPHAEIILTLVKAHGQDSKSIAEKLKVQGIISVNSYHKDTQMWKPVYELLNPEQHKA